MASEWALSTAARYTQGYELLELANVLDAAKLAGFHAGILQNPEEAYVRKLKQERDTARAAGVAAGQASMLSRAQEATGLLMLRVCLPLLEYEDAPPETEQSKDEGALTRFLHGQNGKSDAGDCEPDYPVGPVVTAPATMGRTYTQPPISYEED